MLWKREYLLGTSTPDAKSTYRAWQQEGERAFNDSPVSFATHLSQKYLSYGVPPKWRKRRSGKHELLLSKLQGASGFRPIFSDWPRGAAPLGAVFEFDSPEQRDATRQDFRSMVFIALSTGPRPRGAIERPVIWRVGY